MPPPVNPKMTETADPAAHGSLSRASSRQVLLDAHHGGLSAANCLAATPDFDRKEPFPAGEPEPKPAEAAKDDAAT